MKTEMYFIKVKKIAKNNGCCDSNQILSRSTTKVRYIYCRKAECILIIRVIIL